MASLVFRQQDSPKYLPGIYATLASQVLLLVLLALTSFDYWKKNQTLRAGTAKGPLEGQIGFLYTL